MENRRERTVTAVVVVLIFVNWSYQFQDIDFLPLTYVPAGAESPPAPPKPGNEPESRMNW